MPVTHVIYHLVGYKVGCTKDLRARKKAYRHKRGHHVIIRILEELHDCTDQQAGDIEWAWSDSFGYKRIMRAAHSPGSYLDMPREMQLLVQSLALQLDRMPGDLAAELGDRVQELADHLETGLRQVPELPQGILPKGRWEAQ